MVYASLDLEQELWKKFQFICGVDEVGRGCFAGPVVAGAVIFPRDCELIEGIADSKLLTPKKRHELGIKIQESAIDWAIGVIDVETINNVGIGVATNLAFLEAIKNLKVSPEFVLIDAFMIKGFENNRQAAVEGGDRKCASIAAASIIAKVYRDELMQKLDQDYPGYGLSINKGYGTKLHREAIRELGLSKIHRKSFKLEKFLGVR